MRRVVLPAAVSILLAVSCSGDRDEGPPAQPANTVVLDGRVANDHGSVAVSAGETVPVRAGDFYFQPTVLTGPAGERVVLEVTVEGDGTHNVSVGDIDQDVTAEEPQRVELTFPDQGTLVFVCKYHQARGMAGALVTA